MFPCFGCINGHLGMPVVGRGDNDGINIISGEHVFVVCISLGSGPHFTSCTITSNICCSSHGLLGMDIKKVAYAGHADIKIVLFLEISVPLILGVCRRLVFQFLYSIRMCKSCSFH